MVNQIQHFSHASIKSRIGAGLFDGVIIFFVASLLKMVFIFLAFFLAGGDSGAPEWTQHGIGSILAIIISAIVAAPILLVSFVGVLGLDLLLSWPYFAYFESSKKQATLGKQLFGIHVIATDGKAPTFKQASIRHVGRAIIVLSYGLVFISTSFTANRQSISDLMAKTYVIKRPQS